MAYVQMNTSPVWPPAGIALAALLLFGSNLWPGITLGVLLGSLFTGAPFALALGMSIGNTLEALLGVYLLRHFLDFHNALDRIRDVISLAFASLIVTTIGASFGSVTLALLDNSLWQSFGSIWVTWWIGDLLGALVVAPLLLTWLIPPWLKDNWRRYLEGIILFAVLALITWYVFSNNPPLGTPHQALLYVIFPLMIWIGGDEQRHFESRRSQRTTRSGEHGELDRNLREAADRVGGITGARGHAECDGQAPSTGVVGA